MPEKRKHSSKKKKRSKSRSRSRRSRSRRHRRDRSTSDSDSPYRRGKKSRKRLKYSRSRIKSRSRSSRSARHHSDTESATDKLAKILETLVKGSPATGMSTPLPSASPGFPATARSSHSAHLPQMIKGKLPSDLIFRSALIIFSNLQRMNKYFSNLNSQNIM